LGIEQVAFVYKTGVCKITAPYALKDVVSLKHIHNGKEQSSIYVHRNDGVPIATLPFEIDYLAASFHDFLCLNKNGFVT